MLVFVAMSLVYAAATYGLWRVVFPRLHRPRFAVEIALQTLCAFAVFSFLALTFTEIFTHIFTLPPPAAVESAAPGHVIGRWLPQPRRPLPMRLFPVMPTVLIALIGYHTIFRRILTLQDRERELTELAATAQLAALRSQMSPHFLFNSLNSIAQLIHVDPDRAEECVQKLAAIFRYLLRRADQDFVPLAEELEVAEGYLDIERARFGERLRVETSIDPRSLRHLIPTLVLQPLVENAVKHGLSSKIGQGTVRITTRIDGGVLELTVGDDGRGMTPAVLGQIWERGVGLKNLRERLQRLYGEGHLPEITSAPGTGTRVCLRLPVRSAEAA
jgi:two-component system LytT family sensor kinase